MDFYQGNGNDLDELDQHRHNASAAKGGGGSNFAFLGGSVRYLRAGGSVYPVNLWAVTDLYRTNGAAVIP